MKKRKQSSKALAVDARRSPWIYALVIAACALIALFVVYRPALGGPFVFDDNTLVFRDPNVAARSFRGWLIGVRPLLMISFWMNYRVWGEEPYSYHVFNVLFHFVNSILVYLFARKFLGWSGTDGFRREVLAVFAGGLFLLHPLQTESVSYVASRSEALSILFCYGAFALFLYRRSQAISWRVSIGVLLLFMAAISTKEHTVVFPALLLLTDYYWNPAFSFQGIRKNWRLYAPIALGGTFGLYGVYTVLHGASTAGFGLKDLPWYQYFFTECRVIWTYIRLFFFPAGQTIDYDYPISRTLFSHGAIFGLAALILLAAAAIYYRRPYRLASFGILVFLLLLAPTSSIIPIKDPIAERRAYLPLIGLIFVVLELLRRWKATPRVLIGTTALLLAATGALCYHRNGVWAGAVPLWQDAAAKSPGQPRAHFQLAYAYYAEGRCDSAVNEYEEVARLGQTDYRLLVDWSEALDCLGRQNEAIDKLQKALAMERTAHVYALLGKNYAKQAKYVQARTALSTAEQIDPKFDGIYMYRGNLDEVTNDLAGAAAEYRRALAMNPQNSVARDGLMRVESRLRSSR